jgi:hypothetical protein
LTAGPPNEHESVNRPGNVSKVDWMMAFALPTGDARSMELMEKLLAKIQRPSAGEGRSGVKAVRRQSSETPRPVAKRRQAVRVSGQQQGRIIARSIPHAKWTGQLK